MLHLAIRLWLLDAKGFQRLRLRGGGEGEVAGVGEQLLGLRQLVELVFEGFALLLVIYARSTGSKDNLMADARMLLNDLED